MTSHFLSEIVTPHLLICYLNTLEQTLTKSF
jgi:hypothetical protein